MVTISRDRAIQIIGSEAELDRRVENAKRINHPEIARLKGGVAKLYVKINSPDEFLLADDEAGSITKALARGESKLL